MKGIFLYYKKIDYSNLTGIDKKVLWQIEAFKNSGIDCELIIMEKNNKSFLRGFLDKILVSIPYGNAYPKWKYLDEYNNIDFIYFRRPTCFTIHSVRVLKKIKKVNPTCKIVLEIPTYPYDKEMLVKLRYIALYIKDKYNRVKLKKYVDRIAVQNNIDYLFDIKTLNFINGVKVEDINIRNPKESAPNTINLCGIASLNSWQGYERVIEGIYNYYQEKGDKNIIFHIVGDGTEFQKYKELTNELHLNDHIKFYGSLYGENLDEIYNLSDIALDAFGRFKTGNDISTSLKSREYLAKGLPIVSGCKVDILDKDSPYYLEFPNDISTLNINRVIQFYDEIYANCESKIEVSKNIRKMAYEVCDVSKTMKDVVEFIRT